LALVTDQISASVLCPYFVPTGIGMSHRNRPAESAQQAAKPSKSQMIAHAMLNKAVAGGKVTATEVAQKVFDAVRARQFYIYSHPEALSSVQTRMEDVLLSRNPTDPFANRPALGAELKKALRAD
jgi:predicted membrane-bound mannosyltransferase